MSKIRSIAADRVGLGRWHQHGAKPDDAERAAGWGRTEGRMMTHDVFCEYCGDCRDCSEDDYCIAAEEGKHYFAVYESSHSVK